MVNPLGKGKRSEQLVEGGPASITDISYSGGAATVTFDCVPGWKYNIYCKDSVDDAWTFIEQITRQREGTEYVDDGTLTCPGPIDTSTRFYKIGL